MKKSTNTGRGYTAESVEEIRQNAYDSGYEDGGAAVHESSALLDAARLADYTGVPASTWHALASLEVGPESFKFAGHRVWRTSDVQAWRNDLERRHADERDALAAVADAFEEVRNRFDR